MVKLKLLIVSFWVLIGALSTVKAQDDLSNITNGYDNVYIGESSKFSFDNKPQSLMIFTDSHSNPIITIRPDGNVILSEGLELNEASKLFWEQVQKIGVKLACPVNENK